MAKRPLSVFTILAVLLGSTMALTLVAAGPAQATAVSVTVNDVLYTADDANQAAGATAASSGAGVPADLVIPDEVAIAGVVYSVTAIGDNAFNTKSLTSVTIPDSVTTIGDAAFATNQLTSIVIPDSVTVITNAAFNTNQLTSVTIPNSVTTIERAAFAYNQLTSVTIPNSVTAIGIGAFTENQLTSVTIPNSVTTISRAAFATNQLTSVTIPESVTTIDDIAFAYNQLTSVTIPASVTYIESMAFGVNPLTSATFLGAPPANFTAPNVPGTGGGSLGDSAATTVFYPSAFEAPGFPNGFTTPTWKGYQSAPLAPIITLTPATLPEATLGGSYTQPLTAAGGTGPYNYAITTGALPAGLALSATGVLSGTLTGSESGAFAFTVTVTATGFTGSRAYLLTVRPPSLPDPVGPPGPPGGPAPETTPRLVAKNVHQRAKIGRITRVRVVVINRGESTATNLRAKIKRLPGRVQVNTRTKRIGALAPGKRRVIVFEVKVKKTKATRHRARFNVTILARATATETSRITLRLRPPNRP